MKLSYVISIVLPGMVAVFKKLFGGKEAPIKEGKSDSSRKPDGRRWIKKFHIILSNMEGGPSYSLTHQLTVGSEVGNIVIADPSVSPRHCTFIVQDEVVSVIDHGSISGTFINDQKVTAGKYIILEDTDTVKIGDLAVLVLVKNEPVESAKKIEVSAPLKEMDEVEGEPVEDVVEISPKKPVKASGGKAKASKFSFFKMFSPKKKEAPAPKPVKATAGKKTKAVAVKGAEPAYATNSLVRLIAVIGDLLIAYSLFVIFYPFDEFRIFINDLPGMVSDLLDLDWNGFTTVLNEEYPFVGEMMTDLYKLFSLTFNFVPLMILFIAVRLVSTLLFGVSISEGVLGIKSAGNIIWKRVGGGVRVLIGIVTGPFLIFDIPAIVSRRTFKEFMTFTRTYLDSKFVAILGIILYMPLLLALALLSPLLQGLELPEPIIFNDKLDMRVKVVPAEGAAEILKTKDSSRFLNLELDYDANAISLIPLFKFSGQKKKLNYKPSFVLYQKDLQRTVQVELFKTFDFQELLGIAIRNDYFLQEKFPEVEGFVHSSGLAGTAFKKSNNEKENRKFADEVVALTKIAFEMSADNAFENMQVYTPFLKGLMDYRSSFLALCEYKEFDQFEFIKFGNAYFIRITYSNRQKPFDLIIPLIKGDGRIFKVEFDKKENLGALRNKFYKFSLNDSNWFPAKIAGNQGETLKPLEVLDFFSQMSLKGDGIQASKAQALYGFYFERSAEVLKKDDTMELEIWKKSVEGVFAIMESMKNAALKAKPAPQVAPVPVPEATIEAPVTAEAPVPEEAPAPVEEDPRLKLFQNFQDLKDAVENKNKEFFGIEASTTI